MCDLEISPIEAIEELQLPVQSIQPLAMGLGVNPVSALIQEISQELALEEYLAEKKLDVSQEQQAECLAELNQPINEQSNQEEVLMENSFSNPLDIENNKLNESSLNDYSLLSLNAEKFSQELENNHLLVKQEQRLNVESRTADTEICQINQENYESVLEIMKRAKEINSLFSQQCKRHPEQISSLSKSMIKDLIALTSQKDLTQPISKTLSTDIENKMSFLQQLQSQNSSRFMLEDIQREVLHSLDYTQSESITDLLGKIHQVESHLNTLESQQEVNITYSRQIEIEKLKVNLDNLSFDARLATVKIEQILEQALNFFGCSETELNEAIEDRFIQVNDDKNYDFRPLLEHPKVTGGKNSPKFEVDGKKNIPIPTRHAVEVEKVEDPKTEKRCLEYNDILLDPGESIQDALASIKTVVGKRISEIPLLKAAWERAKEDVLTKNGLTLYNYQELDGQEIKKLYPATRRQFWIEIRKDNVAVEFLNNAGIELPGFDSRCPDPNNSKAAILSRINPEVPDREKRLSLDHVIEQRVDPKLSLEADNFRIEIESANSWREITQKRHKLNLRST